MTSGFSGDFFYGTGEGGGAGKPSMAAIGGNQGGVSSYGLRQQPQQQGIFTADQIAQRRDELLMGKRSFGDFQSYQQQIHLIQQQQQQQSQPISMILQQQYLMRSVKQRNNNFVSSPISPLSHTVDICSPNNSLSHEFINPSSSARVGVPVYQQLRSYQQPQISLRNQPNQINSTHTSLIQTCNNNTFTNNVNDLLNPVGYPSFGSNLIQTNTGRVSGSDIGLSNLSPNPVQIKPDPEDHKILNTLEELEKQLLNDDDDDNHDEGDAVSAITNSEWSETFKNLMGPGPDPNPSPTMGQSPNMGSVSTSGSNNSTTINNNNMISPSPTSSTSSCCSTSASQAAPPSPPPMSTKQLISEAASAISDGKIDAAMEALGRLSQAANPRGSSEQRLAFYMGNALRSRACPNENPPSIMELYGKEQMSAMYNLYDLSPCFKFGLLAANLVMLEAITSALQEGLKIHVVDFHVGHLGQYVNLLRALAERRSQSGNRVATELKITVVETELGNGADMAESVKEELVKVADRVGINLRFDVVTRKINELTSESLGCDDGEAVVVNFAFELHRVPDESVSMENLRDELLRRMKSLSPRAVTLVEQDMNANTAPFMTRVNETCAYYGALLDSLESTIPKDNTDRARVEEGLGRKIANAVACEGRERVERAEVFGKWRARMGMAGFELKPLSQSVAESMRAKLNSARGGNPGFTVKEESGGVGFGWMGRTLTVASAWR